SSHNRHSIRPGPGAGPRPGFVSAWSLSPPCSGGPAPGRVPLHPGGDGPPDQFFSLTSGRIPSFPRQPVTDGQIEPVLADLTDLRASAEHSDWTIGWA